MSKHETPLTRRYWKEIGGTLIEEFEAVSLRRNPYQARRNIDGVVVLDGPHEIRKAHEVEIENYDIVVIQTKSSEKGYTLGMCLLGQALFSRHLMEGFGPKSIRVVAICTKGDVVMEALAEKYEIEVVVYVKDKNHDD